MRCKLFVWHGVLCDYGCGHIAVIAKNLKRARELALMEANSADRQTLEEKKPTVYDMREEAVIRCHGSGQMRCHVGLKSEYEWYFNGASHSVLYGKGNESIMGAADVNTQQTWVFIDKIVKPRDIISDTIKAIVGTTIHELVHLCGHSDEAVANRAEELLVWDGWSWCYRPLPPYQGK